MKDDRWYLRSLLVGLPVLYMEVPAGDILERERLVLNLAARLSVIDFHQRFPRVVKPLPLTKTPSVADTPQQVRWRVARGVPADGQEPTGYFRSSSGLMDLISGEDEDERRTHSAATGWPDVATPSWRNAKTPLAMHVLAEAGASLSDCLVEVDELPDYQPVRLCSEIEGSHQTALGTISALYPSQRRFTSRRYEDYPYHDGYLVNWRRPRKGRGMKKP